MGGKAFIFPDEPIEGDEAKLFLSKTGNYDIVEVTISAMSMEFPRTRKLSLYIHAITWKNLVVLNMARYRKASVGQYLPQYIVLPIILCPIFNMSQEVCLI